MFGKLLGDTIIFAPKGALKFPENGKYRFILNPRKKHYLLAGYKEIEYGKNTIEGEYEEIYTQGDDFIHIDYVAIG